MGRVCLLAVVAAALTILFSPSDPIDPDSRGLVPA